MNTHKTIKSGLKVLNMKPAKLKSTTLVEVIIAMVIVGMSFTIGLSIYLNVLKSNVVNRKLKAIAVVQQMQVQTVLEKDYTAKSIEDTGLSIVKTVEEAGEGLFLIQYEVSQNDKVLYQRNSLVYDEAN